VIFIQILFTGRCKRAGANIEKLHFERERERGNVEKKDVNNLQPSHKTPFLVAKILVMTKD
jgi:hypothetical protein